MTDQDCFPLSKAEAQELFRLLWRATGGLVDMQAPPDGIARQPIHRRPYLWTWHLLRLLASAANTATVEEQTYAPHPGATLSVEQRTALREKDGRRIEKATAALLARLADHDRQHRAVARQRLAEMTARLLGNDGGQE